MSNRKIVLIIVGIVVTITIVFLIFVGGIVGVALYSVSNSEAANTARNFLKNSEKLRADIGEVKDFGSIVTGSVNINNESGQATVNIKVIGANETVNASVDMVFIHGREWRVVSASYVNNSGQTIHLQDPYDSKLLTSPPLVLAA
jgi:hypothetical protein